MAVVTSLLMGCDAARPRARAVCEAQEPRAGQQTLARHSQETIYSFLEIDC